MPRWGQILEELNQTQPPDFDGVRRRYLDHLHRHTDRTVVLYASGWLQKPGIPSGLTSINDEDIHALMEVTAGIASENLDLILHSPGGFPEAAEGIVTYLRSRFQNIRVIVPQLAMSAATMIACAADEVVMGKHSFLGPVDPQFPIGDQLVPAGAILDQFHRAQEECADPAKLAAWLPLLQRYHPGLLSQCRRAEELSKELVRTWLGTYMFPDAEDREQRAEDIAEWLSNHRMFKSHSRHLSKTVLEEHGMIVSALEEDDDLQDLCLSVFHAATHTLSATPAAKIVENHEGQAHIKQANPVAVNIQGPIQLPQLQPPTPDPNAAPA